MYQTGDIFHCTGHRLTSKAISLFTRSKITHTAMFIECWGQPFIVEAQAKGVYIIPFEEWKAKWKYEYIVHRSPVGIDEKMISVKAMTKLGHTAYDFEGLLVRMPVKLITGRWKNRTNEGDKMFCSEYIAWCNNIPNNDRMSPADLYKYCTNNNYQNVT